MLGVTSQTLFTTLFKGVEKNLVCIYECVSQLSCKFHRKTREKEEVSQNLLARIAGSGSDWF